MKKALSIILAIAMLLGCSLSAFAAVNAEMCDYCGDGTVVWDPDWTEIEGTKSTIEFCDEHKCDAATWQEYRFYVCQDCGEIAMKEYRDVFHCFGTNTFVYSNYQRVFN